MNASQPRDSKSGNASLSTAKTGGAGRYRDPHDPASLLRHPAALRFPLSAFAAEPAHDANSCPCRYLSVVGGCNDCHTDGFCAERRQDAGGGMADRQPAGFAGAWARPIR